MDQEDFHDLLAEADSPDGLAERLLTDSTVVNSIEKVFQELTTGVARRDQDLAISLRRRPTGGVKVDLSRPASDAVHAQRICFPGKNAEEAWRFTMIVRILELIHEALRTDVVLSKRDIFYRDPALFGTQARVDRYVDDIAYTFDVPRSKLNVSAVAKGLIAGAVTFCRRDGSSYSAADDREGILVPSLRDLLAANLTSVKWILVVEKEATFRSIASSTFWENISSKGIMVTGKGYPDIATRAMLRFLSLPSPQNGFCSPSVYGLFDFDPDGLAIMSVFKHGSIALAHEGANLCVPEMQWLGLNREQFITGEQDTHAQQGLLHLTTRDRRKAVKMLERCYDAATRSALQRMLLLNIKAELQNMDSSPDGMMKLLKGGIDEIY